MKESPCSIPAAAVLHLGGPAQFYQALLATDSSNFAAPLGGNVGLITAGTIAGSLSVGLSSLGQPHLVARFLALRDERALKQGQLIATAWYTVVFFWHVCSGVCR